MKPLGFILILVLICCSITHAQVPQKFSFQGAARDAAGKVVANKNVGVRFTIRPNTVLGTPVFREKHLVQTNGQGVFSATVGGGVIELGEISQIDWTTSIYVLQTELDIEGSENYLNLGATQLLSVPYALQAKTAEDAKMSVHANSANEARKWNHFNPVIQEGNPAKGEDLPNLNWAENSQKLIWYPKRAAFRFGAWDNATFSNADIGWYSFAGGEHAVASGQGSFAFGYDAKAKERSAIAIGYNSEAHSISALALGSSNTALGYLSTAIGTSCNSSGAHSFAAGAYSTSLADFSLAIGVGLQSRSKYSMVLGIHNDISDAVTNDLEPTRRLFQIGNGSSNEDSRSNALTILRNGNVGIGNNVLAPTHILDIGHRIRLRSNPGYTAGIWLDNSDHVPYSFIGGYNNSEVGIYFEEGAAWRFNVHKNGSAWLAGTLTQNSDLRLKQDLQPLTGSLAKLNELRGYHYHWKDKTRSRALQTGLIAQEVETVFPELVETEAQGIKSVNYIGLIPHLVDAVNELTKANSELLNSNRQLESEIDALKNSQDTTASRNVDRQIESAFPLVLLAGLMIVAIVRGRSA